MMHPFSKRFLIVNADDFGLSPGVNQGIIKAHEDGIVTSASLMVRWPAAAEAAMYARAHPQLSVGLHLDLCEWRFADEEWQLAYEVVSAGDAAAVQDEIAHQLKAFQALTGRYPTHLDSHQHVHRSEPVLSAMRKVAQELGVVLRSFDPAVNYCGKFYGQSDKGYPYPEGISVASLLDILHELPPGCIELGCHPALGSDVDSVYRFERATECQTLCDPRIRSALSSKGVKLCSFANWRAMAMQI